MTKRILSVGHMQFPLGQAQVQRQLLMAKAIQLEGYVVTVLCRYGIHKRSDNVEREGSFEDVHYVYCSGSTIRPQNIIKRNLLKAKGMLNEIRHYRKYSKNKELAGVLVSTNRFHNVVFYFLLGRIFKTITVIDTVEYWSSNKYNKFWLKFDNYLYDRYYFYFADRIICISDFLTSRVGKSKRQKVLKIPVIADYDKFAELNHSPSPVNGTYFLFCGTKTYHEVIDFVISAFEILDREGIYLVLVTQHSEALSQRVAESPRKDMIIIASNILYERLINLYTHSEGLIIPMRNTEQDKARFPHKIGEYCASRRPIITNKTGEISNYFNEGNAYLCGGYNEKEFAEAMGRILGEPDRASFIAGNSYMTGYENFNYKSYTKEIISLFRKR